MNIPRLHRRFTLQRIGLSSILIALATLPAAELVRRDLSLTVEAMPTPFDYDVNQNQGGTRNGSDTFDHAIGLRIGPQWGSAHPGIPWGWIAGAELSVADYAYKSYVTYQTVGLNVMGGGAWAFADRWQATLAPVVGYGFGKSTVAESALLPGVDASGTYLSYGLRAGATYAWTRQWLVGIEVGYLSIQSSLDVDGGRTMTIDQAGPTAALSITWRWAAAPAPLE